jgi:thioredoxin 1
MRIVVACLLLVLTPPLAVFALKQFQSPAIALQDVSQARPATRGETKRGEVLFFNASWCGPCRQMKPIVAAMRQQGYHMRDVDVDKNRSLAQKYGIRAIPTFVFLENGREVKRLSGGTSCENLRNLCASPLYR